MTRPSVSLIVPFADTDTELQRLLADLRQVRLARGDEVIIADNRRRHGGTESDRDRVSIVEATGTRAAGYARNCAARTATGEWLLFIDADTQPPSSLLDDYFDPTPA